MFGLTGRRYLLLPFLGLLKACDGYRSIHLVSVELIVT